MIVYVELSVLLQKLLMSDTRLYINLFVNTLHLWLSRLYKVQYLENTHGCVSL